jgi:hypothetical protein
MKVKTRVFVDEWVGDALQHFKTMNRTAVAPSSSGSQTSLETFPTNKFDESAIGSTEQTLVSVGAFSLMLYWTSCSCMEPCRTRHLAPKCPDR